MKNAVLLSILLLFNTSLLSERLDPKSQSQAKAEKTILFFGNSITAGMGLRPSNAFPSLIQDKIDQLGWPFKVVNAGLSGETSAGGLRRINWILKKPADIFILELGANDGLRGISPETTKKNLQGIIDLAKKKNPAMKMIIAGMQVPPNLGKAYTDSFQQIFPELAKENRAQLIPFLLEGVGGQPNLNLPDGIHPNVEGHKMVAENVWKILEPLLKNDLN
ncbi:lipolytic protein G-D-S-L family [Chloroherpeton thalassium ATCC 35110]|uniref:Lipolytic protein G-D-S-L family n=1 Tax=Chloroherpeton thalassium (strain ATCC 35110 / GB-78) TaxID=517418 RepID=B3QTC5_CHLT3|nr:arylesterase [Chloroherpeton thalassium]ACF14224.1 lipolytic protein G-D-S-L family [Chloroherpeton thalassium ATCC 35110]